jgi:HEAT repeat protein
MSSLRIALLAVLAAMAVGTQSPEASAQGQKHKVTAKAKHEKPGAKVDAAKMKTELESGDSARMIAALEELIKAGEGGTSAAPYVASLLKRGASSDVLLKALEAAGALKQESTSSAVAPYVKHRLSDVRHAATKALIKTKGPDAVKALRGALRSSDAQVRGIAATGLGALGAKESLDDLYTALAHNVGEAAEAIGQLCAGKDCEKLAELTGKHPFDVMSSGFDQILFRPEKEMPEDEKIRIVGRLRELGTKEAGKYLNDVKGRWPKDWSKRVKQAIDSAVRATGGAGGED